MRISPRALAPLCFVFSACQFDSTLPPGVTVTCHDTAECPPGLYCLVEESRCIAAADDGKAPGVVPGTQQLVLVAPPGDYPAGFVARALGPQGQALITFTATEALSVTPVLSASAPLNCVVSSGASPMVQASCVVSGSAVDGPVDVTATLVDLTGSHASVVLSELQLIIDATAPAAPRVDLPDTVIYHQVPWGDAETDGGVWYNVTGAAGATEASALLRVGDGVDVTLGWGSADTAGAFDVKLEAIGAAQVQIQAIDTAGNRSPEVLVADIEWVATLGGKHYGSDSPNPHRQSWVGALGYAAAAPDVTESLSPLVLPGDIWRTGAQGAPSWRLLSFSQPALAAPPAIATNGDRARVAVFSQEGLWEWTGQSWLQPTAVGSTGPIPRAGGALVYEQETGTFLLVSGESATSLLSDAWEWDGVKWAFVRSSPVGGLPALPARRDLSMCYDAARGSTVTFGGIGVGRSTLSATFVFDARLWLPYAGQTPEPPPRSLAAFGYDERNARCMLFGGRSADGGALQDVWAFVRHDGSYNWEPMAPAHSPAARVGATLVNEPITGQLVLMGGTLDDGGLASDIWSWDGTDFTPRGASVPGPGVGALDAVPGRIVWLTATDGGTETWALDVLDGGWQRLHSPQAVPGPRYAHTLTQVPGSGDVLLFGGTASGAPLSDAWRFDGQRWSQVGGAVPPARAHHAAAAEDLLGAVVVTGGEGVSGALDDTWTFSVDAGFLSLGSQPLAQRARPVMTHVRSGGLNSLVSIGDTPAQSGVLKLDLSTGTWSNAVALSMLLPPVSGIDAVGLPDGGALFTGLIDGGTTEVGLEPQTGSVGFQVLRPVATGTAAACCSAHGATTFFGGQLTDGTLASSIVGTWVGDDFALENTSDPDGDGDPSPRAEAAMALSGARQSLLLFGGRNGAGQELGELWELDDADARPAELFEIDVPQAAIPATATLLSLTTTALATGSAPLVSGAQLLVHHAGRWWNGGAASASTASDQMFAPLTLTVNDPLMLTQLLLHQRRLTVAVSSRGARVAGDSKVALDYIEARVRYRLSTP